jgi:hypothetical protein
MIHETREMTKKYRSPGPVVYTSPDIFRIIV